MYFPVLRSSVEMFAERTHGSRHHGDGLPVGEAPVHDQEPWPKKLEVHLPGTDPNPEDDGILKSGVSGTGSVSTGT